jgi:predicted nucleic acid-binding protein
MIIFDSSTLILLTKVELLDDFLEDYEGKILIPREVEAESCGRKKSFDALFLRNMIQEKKIGVAKVSNTALCNRLMRDFRICRGEAEALVLALEKKAKLVATDDKNAIKACKLLKLSFTSAIAMLIKMAEREVIDAEKTRVALKALTKYGRYSDEIIKEAKERLKTR